jgi:hypothetical protein
VDIGLLEANIIYIKQLKSTKQVTIPIILNKFFEDIFCIGAFMVMLTVGVNGLILELVFCKGLPQAGQKFTPSCNGEPHFEQNKVIPPKY